MSFSLAATGVLGLAALLIAPASAEASKIEMFSENVQSAAVVAEQTLEQQIATAEQGIVRERIWVYRGFVEDASGKKMHGVKIDVFRSGSGGKNPLATTRSDSRGHFLVHLTNGNYTAVMQAQGFSPLIYIFEISYEGVEKELRFRLARTSST